MAALTGNAIKDSYKDLLQVSNSNSGVDTTLRDVEDGEGTASALQVSTAAVKSTGTLEVTGVVTLASALRSADGSEAAPAWSFSGDTDTGFYRSSANTLTATIGGTDRWSATTGGIQSASFNTGSVAGGGFELRSGSSDARITLQLPSTAGDDENIWRGFKGTTETSQIDADGDFVTISDARVKPGIKDKQRSVGLLGQLSIKEWQSPEKGRKIGISASDLEAIYPEFVKTNEAGFKMIAESKLVYPLIEEIQDIRARLDAAGL